MPKARESKEPSWASENDMQSIASWQPQKEYTHHIDVTNQKYLHIMSLFFANNFAFRNIFFNYAIVSRI